MSATLTPQAQVTSGRRRLVLLLAITQTIGYGTMIQAFTVLLIPMAHDLGHSRTAITGAATISTLAGALAAVPVGRLLDRHGGRLLMAAGSVLGAIAVVGWSQAHTLGELYLWFALIGVALALSTYEAAFAVLVVATGPRHRDGAIVAQVGAVTAFLLIMVSYFRDVGYSPAAASTMPLAVGVLQILSRLALGPLARRYGMTRVTAVAFAVQGLGLLLLPLAGTHLVATVACVAAFGAGYGIGVVARPSIIADTFGVARFASIIAITTVPIALSRAGAPLLAAWLADWRFLVLLGAGTLIAAAALAQLTRQPEPS